MWLFATLYSFVPNYVEQQDSMIESRWYDFHLTQTLHLTTFIVSNWRWQLDVIFTVYQWYGFVILYCVYTTLSLLTENSNRANFRSLEYYRKEDTQIVYN